MSTQFVRQPNPHPATDEVRNAILANPGFGVHFTDNMISIDWTGDVEKGNGQWENPRLEPYGPIALDPSAAVFHYGQEIFEGSRPTGTRTVPCGPFARRRTRLA